MLLLAISIGHLLAISIVQLAMLFSTSIVSPPLFVAMTTLALASASANRRLQEDDANSNSTDSSMNNKAAMAKDIFIILLAGVAIVIGLVLLTYLLTVILDRYCSMRPELGAVAGVSTLDQIDQGIVARKANLYGLRQAERIKILPVVLAKTTFTFPADRDGAVEGTQSDGRAHTMEMELTELRPMSATMQTATTTDAVADGNVVPPELDIENDAIPAVAATVPIMEANISHDEICGVVLGDADHDQVCGICLSAYRAGERLVTGTLCRHQFHAACCLKWLHQHDHCPYCRVEMMTAREFRHAAGQVLGRARVHELAYYNHRPAQQQEAAAAADQSLLTSTRATATVLARTASTPTTVDAAPPTVRNGSMPDSLLGGMSVAFSSGGASSADIAAGLAAALQHERQQSQQRQRHHQTTMSPPLHDDSINGT